MLVSYIKSHGTVSYTPNAIVDSPLDTSRRTFYELRHVHIIGILSTSMFHYKKEGMIYMNT